MLRIIIEKSNYLNFSIKTGLIRSGYSTFDVDLPQIESFLRKEDISSHPEYEVRKVIGIEILDEQKAAQCPVCGSNHPNDNIPF